ncbi:hypothetical protein ACFFL1_14060 [Samsonia erythrinae]|uniref:Uncharacterized protein n=1 Tax=Samsonia erythrinae TaxID=160434 RepID=A0A4R3VNB1_9GAMM|nr:hypothetical protein [Samsonia erythrinae]TCV05521.1 hypothetical protein EDC54_106158 [Samsonia erythrinae]
MTNRIRNLNTDRLNDPRRRELPTGGVVAVGLSGFLGGCVWSLPIEEGERPSSETGQPQRRLSAEI